jgi:hypothetical protein
MECRELVEGYIKKPGAWDEFLSELNPDSLIPKGEMVKIEPSEFSYP